MIIRDEENKVNPIIQQKSDGTISAIQFAPAADRLIRQSRRARPDTSLTFVLQAADSILLPCGRLG